MCRHLSSLVLEGPVFKTVFQMVACSFPVTGKSGDNAKLGIWLVSGDQKEGDCRLQALGFFLK